MPTPDNDNKKGGQREELYQENINDPVAPEYDRSKDNLSDDEDDLVSVSYEDDRSQDAQNLAPVIPQSTPPIPQPEIDEDIANGDLTNDEDDLSDDAPPPTAPIPEEDDLTEEDDLSEEDNLSDETNAENDDLGDDSEDSTTDTDTSSPPADTEEDDSETEDTDTEEKEHNWFDGSSGEASELSALMDNIEKKEKEEKENPTNEATTQQDTEVETVPTQETGSDENDNLEDGSGEGDLVDETVNESANSEAPLQDETVTPQEPSNPAKEDEEAYSALLGTSASEGQETLAVKLSRDAQNNYKKAGVAVGRATGLSKAVVNEPLFTKVLTLGLTKPNQELENQLKELEQTSPFTSFISEGEDISTPLPIESASGINDDYGKSKMDQMEAAAIILAQKLASIEEHTDSTAIAKNLSSSFMQGYNEGYNEGRKIKKENSEKAEKEDKNIIQGKADGRATGLAVVNGEMSADEGVAKAKQPPSDITDAAKYETAFMQGYNWGYMEGRNARAKGDQVFSDPNKQLGHVTGKAIAKAFIANDTKYLVNTGLTEPNQVPQAVMHANANKKPDGSTIDGDQQQLYKEGFFIGYPKGIGAGAYDVGYKVGIAKATGNTTELKSIGAASVDVAMDNANANKTPAGTAVSDDPNQEYSSGFFGGYNVGYRAGQKALVSKEEQERKTLLQDPNFQKGKAVGQLRGTLVTLYGEANLATQLQSSAFAKNAGEEITNLAGSSDPTANAALEGDAKSKFDQGYKEGLYLGIRNAQKNRFDLEFKQQQQDPEYKKGFADGHSVGKAKIDLIEYQQYINLKDKSPLSSAEQGTLEEAQKRVAGKVETFQKMDAVAQQITDAVPQQSDKYQQGYNGGYNSSYLSSRNQRQKKKEEQNEDLKAKLENGDASTPYNKGFQLGRTFGKQVRSALTADPNKDLGAAINAAYAKAQADEDSGKEGKGFRSGFGYGYNVGYSGASLVNPEAKSEKELEELKKKLVSNTKANKNEKELLDKAFEEGKKEGYDLWYKKAKSGVILGDIQKISVKKKEDKYKTYKDKYSPQQASDLNFVYNQLFNKQGGGNDDSGNGKGYIDGQSFRIGFKAGSAGTNPEPNVPEVKNKKQYLDGYAAGKRDGGLKSYQDQLQAKNGKSKDGADNNMLYNTDEITKEGYKAAFDKWRKIFLIAKGIPVPEKLNNNISSIKIEVNKGITNATDIKIKDEDKEQVELASAYSSAITQWTDVAVRNYYYTQIGSDIDTAVKSLGITEEEKKNDETRKRFNAKLQEAEQAGDQKLINYRKGYESAVQDAEKSIGKVETDDLLYAMGFEEAYQKAAGKPVKNPISAEDIAKAKASVTDFENSRFYKEGYAKGYETATNEKYGLNKGENKGSNSNEIAQYDKGYKKGKDEGETPKTLKEINDDIDEETKNLGESYKATYRRGYEKGYYFTSNFHIGYLDGYYSAQGQTRTPLPQNLQQKEIERYQLGYSQGNQKGQADKAVGIFDEKQRKKSLEEGSKKQEDAKEATKESYLKDANTDAKKAATTNALDAAQAIKSDNEKKAAGNKLETYHQHLIDGLKTFIDSEETIQKENKSEEEQNKIGEAYSTITSNLETILTVEALQGEQPGSATKIKNNAQALLNRFVSTGRINAETTDEDAAKHKAAMGKTLHASVKHWQEYVGRFVSTYEKAWGDEAISAVGTTVANITAMAKHKANYDAGKAFLEQYGQSEKVQNLLKNLGNDNSSDLSQEDQNTNAAKRNALAKNDSDLNEITEALKKTSTSEQQGAIQFFDKLFSKLGTLSSPKYGEFRGKLIKAYPSNGGINTSKIAEVTSAINAVTDAEDKEKHLFLKEIYQEKSGNNIKIKMYKYATEGSPNAISVKLIRALQPTLSDTSLTPYVTAYQKVVEAEKNMNDKKFKMLKSIDMTETGDEAGINYTNLILQYQGSKEEAIGVFRDTYNKTYSTTFYESVSNAIEGSVISGGSGSGSTTTAPVPVIKTNTTTSTDNSTDTPTTSTPSPSPGVEKTSSGEIPVEKETKDESNVGVFQDTLPEQLDYLGDMKGAADLIGGKLASANSALQSLASAQIVDIANFLNNSDSIIESQTDSSKQSNLRQAQMTLEQISQDLRRKLQNENINITLDEEGRVDILKYYQNGQDFPLNIVGLSEYFKDQTEIDGETELELDPGAKTYAIKGDKEDTLIKLTNDSEIKSGVIRYNEATNVIQFLEGSILIPRLEAGLSTILEVSFGEVNINIGTSKGIIGDIALQTSGLGEGIAKQWVAEKSE